MGFENEVKAIPQDLEGLVKGDIKLGKFHIPKVAIASVIVGGVAIFAYVNRNKAGGSTPSNGDVGNGTFGTSQGDSSTVSGGGVGSTDSGTIPVDNSNSNPTPSIPPIFDIPSNNGGSDNGGFSLPSLPNYDGSGGFSLPSFPTDNGYTNQVPYLGYGDGVDYSTPSSGNTGIVTPVYSNSNIVAKVSTPIRGVLGKIAKGVGSASAFSGKPATKSQVQSGAGLGVANLLKGSAFSVKSPITNNVVKSVSGVGGASSFGGVKPIISFNNIQQLKPVIKSTAKPFQNAALLFSNLFKPAPVQPTHYQVSTPVYKPPVYFNYHPTPIPKVNNGINYFKNLSTHVGSGGV